jgi:NAD(P)H dehydrogenase (quinone)
MVKILVVYTSQTGNTKKLALAVCEGIKRKGEPILKEAGEVTNDDLINVQGIIAGSPVYFGGMSSKLKEMFDKSVRVRRSLEGKVGAAFATSGHHTGGKETTLLSIITAMLIHGMIIVGDPISAGGHFGVATVGEPDEETLNCAKALGERVATLAEKLFIY